MAIFRFTKSILKGDEIDVYNFGEMSRDFTYIDDLVHAITLLIDEIPKNYETYTTIKSIEETISSVAPFRVVNLGNSDPIKLMDFIFAIEEAIGLKARINFLPMQQGDVLLLGQILGY